MDINYWWFIMIFFCSSLIVSPVIISLFQEIRKSRKLAFPLGLKYRIIQKGEVFYVQEKGWIFYWTHFSIQTDPVFSMDDIMGQIYDKEFYSLEQAKIYIDYCVEQEGELLLARQEKKSKRKKSKKVVVWECEY